MIMYIFTVSSVDIQPSDPVDTCTVGSFTNIDDAIRECTDYIIDRCRWRPDIRYAIMHDYNHEQVLGVVSEKSGRDRSEIEKKFKYNPIGDRGWGMPREVENALKEYLLHMVYLEGGYHIKTDIDDPEIGDTEWIFEISRNMLHFESGLIVKSVSRRQNDGDEE